MGTFVTAINCIDGRAQAPIAQYLKCRFNAQFVDMITCPGPVKILSSNNPFPMVRYLQESVDISVRMHYSEAIAIAAHFDCAANDISEIKQKHQIIRSVQQVSEWRLGVTIVGLWLNCQWDVEEISVFPIKIKQNVYLKELV